MDDIERWHKIVGSVQFYANVSIEKYCRWTVISIVSDLTTVSIISSVTQLYLRVELLIAVCFGFIENHVTNLARCLRILPSERHTLCAKTVGLLRSVHISFLYFITLIHYLLAYKNIITLILPVCVLIKIRSSIIFLKITSSLQKFQI